MIGDDEPLRSDLSDLRTRGLYRTRRKVQSAQGPRVRWRGREYLNFSSNDYLNLAADPRLAQAAAKAARRFGAGAGSSPLVSGYLPPIRRLERALADWEATDAGVVFSSGYSANVGLITALAGPDDAVFSDALNHASLIDGCRLSKARVQVYHHADANHLADLLRTAEPSRRRLIVTDSVFSMDGDWAPLADLLDLANRHDAWLLVDEAHATGVLGENGRGLLELLRAEEKSSNVRIVKVGTLSKALGSQGGFVCGDDRVMDWLVNRSRSYIYSTGLAPPAAAAASRALAIVQHEPHRRRHLLAMANLLRERLRSAGCKETVSRCQIVPVIVGEASAAMRLSARLADQGLLAPAIRPPSVPEGTARLRISLTAGHTVEDIERLAEALQSCGILERA